MSTEKTIFSVSQLNRRAKQLLETHLPLIWVSGELSNLAKPSSGHWYFSLKDKQAQVRCAMFRGANQRLKWNPESGQQVLIRARVSLYEGRGEYQLIAEHMEAAGSGLLQQQYEALKEKLNSEGLFDQQRKKDLPAFPTQIGVITSPTGAAIHDILSVLKRRYPIAPITIFPVSVQGENAATEMVAAIHKAERYQQCDILVIGRGGGSIEDLWAFNDELLARTIAHCHIPIVSAVGHEVDFTIADFVADQRAPTPSASAEIITPDLNEWQQTLDDYQQQLSIHCQRKIQQQRQQLMFTHKRLRHPKDKIKIQSDQLTRIEKTLTQLITRQLDLQTNQALQLRARLLQQHPQKKIRSNTEKVAQLNQLLTKGINTQINQKQQSFINSVNLLNAINPLTVLSRGYSMTSQKNGAFIKSYKEVNIGDEISTQLSQGNIISVVKSCSEKI